MKRATKKKYFEICVARVSSSHMSLVDGRIEKSRSFFPSISRSKLNH
jgi:hypothetical protein